MTTAEFAVWAAFYVIEAREQNNAIRRTKGGKLTN